MAAKVWIYFACGFMFAVMGGQCACPPSCSCSGTNVKCSGNMSIPEGIPRNVSRLTLSEMSLETIPANVFSDFKNLTHIDFFFSHVKMVNAFAFYGLHNASITFSSCKVDGIESFAFSGIERLHLVEFNYTQISYIDSFGFSNIGSWGSLLFSFSAIKELRPMAIRDIKKFDAFILQNSSMETWGEKAVSNVADLGIVAVVSSFLNTLDSYALFNLTKVNHIFFSESTVMEIKPYAISSIRELDSLGTFNSWFKVIRRNAISNNTLISSISWSYSKIDKVESFALTQNGHINTFGVVFIHIGHLNSFAFNDTSVTNANFDHVIIERLDCGTIEHLQDIVQNRFTFTQVNVTCDSAICWLFHRNRARYLQTTFSDVRCSNPARTISSGLGSLDGMPSENLPFDCSSYNFTANFTCSGTTRPTGQGLSLIVSFALSLMTLGWLATFGNVVT